MANRLRTSTRPYRMAARAESAQANGERIVAVAHDLFAERLFDQVLLEDVAARAGVTVRTVVRRFGTKEHLFALVAAQRARLIRGEREAVITGDVPGAIGMLMDSYEAWGDEVLHLLAQERRADAIAKGVRAGREFHRAWVERVFSPLLKDSPSAQRKRRLAQLTAVTDVYTWKVLRRDLGLSRHEAERSVRELIENVVARRPDSTKAWAG
jgi:AcrR family transcriptional regulator